MIRAQTAPRIRPSRWFAIIGGAWPRGAGATIAAALPDNEECLPTGRPQRRPGIECQPRHVRRSPIRLLLAGYRAAVTDDDAMVLALEEAARAGRDEEVPVGAVVVLDGVVVGRGHNEREQRGDPTAHAEILALQAAAHARAGWRLTGAEVFVTLEPCPMCAGALVAARVARVVFGAADPKAGACGSLYNLCADPRLNHEVEVTAGVMAEPASALLAAFFESRRASAE
jgi:tRNA(adenine34) deaminase